MGNVTLNFNFNELTHAYTMGSYTIPSVTQVMEECGLSGDLSKIPPKILERKREIGTQVHRAAEFLDKNRLDWSSLDAKVVPYVLAYERFCSEHKWKPRLIEFQMVALCDRMPYGMTLDREGMLDGDPWVIDFKCTYDKHKHWKYQTAAYTYGAEHIAGIAHEKEHRRGVLWLRPNGLYEIVEHTDYSDWETFKAALVVATAKRRDAGLYGRGETALASHGS